MSAADIATRSIGHYVIEAVLGEGGMGAVYLARQEKPARHVALKVVRPGLATSRMLKRFEHEAEVLGRLQHPGIAQIYEAGTADTGQGPQPFFAMELVRGATLTDFAKIRFLALRQRLELFAKICDAVEHAHQKGVVHRDLKPANILVTADGQPKVLDFGVARAVGSDIATTTMHTEAGAIIGTLPYMSPEQVGGDPDAIDTRSDVYALGVVLYELLADRLPHDLTRAPLPEAVRRIREEEPARLSSVHRRLRGDVETIVHKALEKEKERRYPSAAALAADVRRYLSDEPITARPANTMYQWRKFARRHKALVGGVVAAFTALTVGLVGTAYGLVRADKARAEAERARIAERDQRAQAERQTAVAQAVNRFLNEDLLGQASPEEQPDKDVKLLTVLDRASERIEGKFEGQPEVEAELRLTLGRVFGKLDLDQKAAPHLERARLLTKSVYGERSEQFAQALHASALALGWREGGAQYSRQAFSIRTELLGATHAQTLLTAGDLAMFEALERGESAALFDRGMLGVIAFTRGKGETVEQVEQVIRELIALGERLEASGRQHETSELIRRECKPFMSVPLLRERIPIALTGAAMVLEEQGFQGCSLALSREAVALGTELLGPLHPDTLRAINQYANRLVSSDDPVRAVALLTDALEKAQRVFGDSQMTALAIRHNLGYALMDAGRLSEAEAMLQFSLQHMEEQRGAEDPSTLIVRGTLATLLKRMKRYEEAEKQYRSVLDGQLRILGRDHLDTAKTADRLAELYLDLGRPAEAEPLSRDVERVYSRHNGPDNPFTRRVRRDRARALRDLSRFAESEALLLENERGGERTEASLVSDHRALVALYKAWDKAEPGNGHDAQAAQWRSKLDAPAQGGQPSQ